MKNVIFYILVMCIGISLDAQVYQLDKDKSQLTWIGYGEVGGFKQTGTIEAKSGSLKLDSLQVVSASISMDMNSIKSDERGLAKHLKNKDFFYSKKYPEASLEVISYEGCRIVAALTIRGKTKQIEFPVVMDNREKELLLSGEVQIDRTIFDIKYNSSSYFQDLGNYAIKNEFDLKFNLVFNQLDN